MRNVYIAEQNSLPMNLHKHQLNVQEQYSEWFKIWLAIIRINTGGKILDHEIQPISKCVKGSHTVKVSL